MNNPLRVRHPQGVYNNNPAENVFIAMDDNGNQYGVGTIVYQHQPDLFPDRPHNMFISLDSETQAQYLLFGALMGRAQQLGQEANPTECARVYTSVMPGDTVRLAFYDHNGFDITVAENVVQLEIPDFQAREPMGCSTRSIPLNTDQEQYEFLYRMQQCGGTYIDKPYLQQMQIQPHFLALGLIYTTPQGQQLIGEIILAGQGNSCEVVAMYIIPPFRRQGFGRILLHRAMNIVATEGVTVMVGRILSNSTPQCRLAGNFSCRVARQETLFPSVYLDPGMSLNI